MSILLALGLFGLKAIFVLSFTLMAALATLFIIEERRAYLRQKNKLHASTGVIRASVVLDLIKRLKALTTVERQKKAIRTQKEVEAHEGFFEESYVRGFDPNGALLARPTKVPTEKAWEYYKMMDQLADTAIFENTREI